jgi:non-homologous end joining protein Ku
MKISLREQNNKHHQFLNITYVENVVQNRSYFLAPSSMTSKHFASNVLAVLLSKVTAAGRP